MLCEEMYKHASNKWICGLLFVLYIVRYRLSILQENSLLFYHSIKWKKVKVAIKVEKHSAD